MISINDALCSRCGRCALLCPAGIIAWEKGQVARCDSSRGCIHCGHCYAACPAGAIVLDNVAPGVMPRVENPSLNPLQRTMLLRGRRSIRAFRRDLVPHDVLDEALVDASYAPTAGNSQKVEWILLEDQALVRAVVSQTAEYLRVSGSKHYARYVQEYDAGIDRILRGASQAIFAHTPTDWPWGAQDASAALSYLELSLHARGIGSCWTGLVIMASQAGQLPAMPMPAGHTMHAGLMVGYADVPYARLPVRKEVRLTVL